jgi:hypothetical protein
MRSDQINSLELGWPPLSILSDVHSPNGPKIYPKIKVWPRVCQHGAAAVKKARADSRQQTADSVKGREVAYVGASKEHGSRVMRVGTSS